MESSKKVVSIKKYLYKEWSEDEVRHFLDRLQYFEQLVIRYPNIYQASEKYPNLRKAVITKHQSVIYEVDQEIIRVHTILNHRENQ